MARDAGHYLKKNKNKKTEYARARYNNKNKIKERKNNPIRGVFQEKLQQQLEKIKNS